MAVELWQIIIPNRVKRRFTVTASPVSQPQLMVEYGPYQTLKEARQEIEQMFPIGNWVNNRRYYTKVENDAPWD